MKLTEKEILQIEIYLKEGYSWPTSIGKKIRRNKSTLSRLFQEFPAETFNAEEVIRIRGEKQSTASRSHCRIEPWWELEAVIVSQIQERKSPEQIAWRYVLEQLIKLCFSHILWLPFSNMKRLSKDTLYKMIYERKSTLKKYLRRKGRKYRHDKKWKYQILWRVMIDERDEKYKEEITDRTRLGHWEWDTVIWKNHGSAIGTFLERYSGYWRISVLPKWKDAMWMVDAMEEVLKTIPKEKRITLTVDNGREFAYHTMVTYLTKTQIYFAHPYASYERWCNENYNWLIRDYFPKKTDFKLISSKQLEKVEKQINSRPRKRLYYFTPYEVFHSTFICCFPF